MRTIGGDIARPCAMWHENALSHSPRQVQLGRHRIARQETGRSNDRGPRDAPKMGERLAKRDVKPDLILSKPAVRALRTAEIIAKKLDYRRKIVVNERLYAVGASQLLDVIHQLGDKVERD